MTADQFRRLALSLPGASERAHMGHPDFRVGGKIFATLGSPDRGWGMVKLTPKDQAEFIASEPNIFVPAAGAWGRQGCTSVRLKPATKAKLFGAIVAGWRNVAPKTLRAEFED